MADLGMSDLEFEVWNLFFGISDLELIAWTCRVFFLIVVYLNWLQ